jgi:hypothetical protein
MAQVSTTQVGITQISTPEIGMAQVSATQINPIQIGFAQVSSNQVAFPQINFITGNFLKSSTLQISASKGNSPELTTTQIGFSQIGVSQARVIQTDSTQVDSREISTVQSNTFQVSSTQVNSAQANSIQVNISKVNSSETNTGKLLFSSSIAVEQFFSSHNTSPTPIYNINNTSLPLWNSYLQPTTPLDLNLVIKDLPTGQLAEAQVTQFSNNGTPTGGTLYLDTDANGLGWYIDPTPWENSEFSQTLTDTAYRATADSLAYGHYDLLTTLLHETAHLQGFISGYSNFDNRVQTINGSKTFIGDTFSAILTPDGSHLSSSVYTYDLMNTTLTPGVRKLPSALDIQILNTLRNPQPITHSTPATAALTAGALIAINNGSFDTNTDWYTRGDSHIINGQAILSEDSPYLSHLSQTFVIPQGAKALQFTLINTDLHSSNTRLAPGDAFEVALLNHTTNTSVLAPLTGLSQTDALLNIQSNGQTYRSSAVTPGWVSGAEPNNTPRTVQIDVSSVAPGTVVTLYFDLLGFGAKDSSVTLDDVQILAELSQAPVAQNDSATTNQNESVTVDVLENDRDPDGTLITSTLLIAQAPQHGPVSLNANGTVTYQPTANYIGSDRFTYLIQDNSGVYSTPAIVNINILNPIPTIDTVSIDSTLNEGTPAQFSSVATIAGNQPLTYTWTLGDGTTTTGQTIQHTYANNGTYTVTLNEGQSATYIDQECDRSHSPKSSAPVKSNNASLKDSS